MSPGPILEPEGTRPDYWRFARAMYAAGIPPGDVVHNAFAYHLTPAGSIIESGARALGCPVIPAGTGQTELQLTVIARVRPAAYAGTPSFLKILLERGRADGVDTSCLKKALVGGEAFPRTLADWFEGEFGVRAYQCYGTADVGLIAYETPAREGLVIDEGVLVEIVRPGTGDPVPRGRGRRAGGHGVQSRLSPDPLRDRRPVGASAGPEPVRTHQPAPARLARPRRPDHQGQGACSSTRGQIAEIVKRHPAVGRARLVVERHEHVDRMTLLLRGRRPPRRAGRGDRRDLDLDHGPARRGRAGRARRARQRRQGDRRPARARLSGRCSAPRSLACVRGGRLVFDGVSFALAPGDALLLRGPNGAGKSSLLRLLAGFLAPSAGALCVGRQAGARPTRPSTAPGCT